MLFNNFRRKILYKFRAFEFSRKTKCKGRKNVVIDKGLILANLNINYGDNFRVYPYVNFRGTGKIIVGNDVCIGFSTSIHSENMVSIGNDVMIAQHVMIVDADHGIDLGTPMRKQKLIQAGVIIEDDVWIGAGVKILKGVHIHKGAVIGAGAVITKDIPENAIAVGVPAKVIGYRK